MTNRITWVVFVALALDGCGDNVDLVTPMTPPEASDHGPQTPWLEVEAWREVPAQDGAGLAISVAKSFLGITGAPDVHWYGGIGLDCGDPNVIGWIETGSNPPHCVGGKENLGLILVATDPRLRISAGSLAHELGHMRAGEVTGNEDPDHLTHWFAHGGEVDQANAILAEMGL